jgi:hypothetical protein
MISRIPYRIAAVLAVMAGVPLLAFAGEEMFEGLKINVDNSGRITSMAVSNPGTSLNIESEFLFSVSPEGNPTSGKITFRDNVQRPMKEGELTFYFQQYGAQTALWDYYSQHGKATSLVIGTDKVPDEAYGKVSRLILNSGKQFIGRLAKLSDKPDGFSLTIDGASGGPIQFYNGVVKEIQQMK